MLESHVGIYINPETVTDTLVTDRRRETHLTKGGNMNIYVGNLSLAVTEAELRQEFTTFGQVISVSVMNDQYIGSGQPRGYGFVEMASRSEGEAAIVGLNGKTLKNRVLSVIEALPLSDSSGVGSGNSRRRNLSNRRVRQRS